MKSKYSENWFQLMCLLDPGIRPTSKLLRKADWGYLMKSGLWNVFQLCRKMFSVSGVISWHHRKHWCWKSTSRSRRAQMTAVMLMCAINLELLNHPTFRFYPINLNRKKAKWTSTDWIYGISTDSVSKYFCSVYWYLTRDESFHCLHSWCLK